MDSSHVTFGSDSANVSLRYLEPYDIGTPQRAARIAVGFVVGVLSSEFNAVGHAFGHYLGGLKSLYDKPTGEWQFATLDGEMRLELRRLQLGAIAAEATIRSFSPEYQLTFRFGMDQSFLPTIIRDFQTQFRSVL